MPLLANLYRLELNASETEFFVKPNAGDLKHDRAGFGWKEHSSGDLVYAWKVRRAAPDLPCAWTRTWVRRVDAPDLFARVIEYGLRRFLRVRGFRRLERGRAECFVETRRNLLRGILPPEADARVGIFPEYEIQRAHVDDLRDPHVAFVTFWMKHRWDLAVPVSELVRLGMNCSGIGARLVELNGLEALHRWRDRAVGIIAQVQDGFVALNDVRAPELARLPAAALHLEGSMPTMQRYLETRYPSAWRRLWKAAQDVAAEASRPRARLASIDKLVDWLNENDIPLAPGLRARIHRLGPKQDFHSGISTVRPTVYVFDYASKLTGPIAARGLREHGPYDKSRPPTRRPVLKVLCPRIYEPSAKIFFQKLCEGCEYPDRKRRYFDHLGFARMLHLEAVDLTFVWFDLAPGTGVAAAYERALEQALARGSQADLWFTVTENAHRDLAPAEDPYCVTKSLLFTHSIPVSNITIEDMTPTSASALPFTLANVTLQAYAKMGGTPFVLRAPPERRIEIILGVGIADVGVSRFGRTRLVGFAAAFRTNGDYLVGNIGPPAERDDYVDKLARVVEESLSDAIAREGATPGAQIRLVFHLYKRPGKDTELAAVQTALKKFTAFDVELAYVQVNESHRWLVVDDDERDGILQRGLLIRTDARTRLLNLIGPGQYLKRGYPAPLQLTVDEDSVDEADRLAQQVYDFANVSWRGFNTGTLPITILYAKLAAELAGKLSETQYWKPSMLRAMLADKRWCL